MCSVSSKSGSGKSLRASVLRTSRGKQRRSRKGEEMAIRNPTDEETQRIIHVSLNTVRNFAHDPDDPLFLEEMISWTDILSILPVTPEFLYTNTLVATEFLFPGSQATMNEFLFFEHLEETDEETVEEYRDFLK